MVNCHSCKYSRSIPGDCHISCAAIVLSNESATKIFAAVTSGIPVLIKAVTDVTGLSFDSYGIQSGYCMFPLNYDPVWMSGTCKLKQLSEDTEAQIAASKQDANLIVKV
jgi:hypothetical protein